MVEIYPRAAILTAWFNAWRSGVVDGLASSEDLRADDPCHSHDGLLNGAGGGRRPLGETLAALPATTPARCALSVPGDPDGLPPLARRAAAAGQAMLVGLPDERTAVFSPTSLGDRRTLWHAEVVPGPLPATTSDVRTERLRMMELLPAAIATAESATLPGAPSTDVARKMAAAAAVPLPPGSAGSAVNLARTAASLLVIVDAALTVGLPPSNTEAEHVRSTLIPLGRAGRRALAVAFTFAGGADGSR